MYNPRGRNCVLFLVPSTFRGKPIKHGEALNHDLKVLLWFFYFHAGTESGPSAGES